MTSAKERPATGDAASSTTKVDRQAATETTTVIADSLLPSGHDKAAGLQQAGQRMLARLGSDEGPAMMGRSILITTGCALLAVAAWRTLHAKQPSSGR